MAAIIIGIWVIFMIFVIIKSIRLQQKLKTMRCLNCQAKIYMQNNGGITYYKYCPKCGLEANKDIKIQSEFASIGARFFLPYVVFGGFLFLTHAIQLDFSGVALYTIGYLLLYWFFNLFNKTCPSCDNFACSRWHTYCYNCGKLL